MGEVWRGHLRFNDASSKQSLPTQNVLVQQFDHHVLDVRDIDLVDDTVDTLSEQLPHQFLVFHTLLALHQFGLELPNFVGRHVYTTGTAGCYAGSS